MKFKKGDIVKAAWGGISFLALVTDTSNEAEAKLSILGEIRGELKPSVMSLEEVIGAWWWEKYLRAISPLEQLAECSEDV